MANETIPVTSNDVREIVDRAWEQGKAAGVRAAQIMFAEEREREKLQSYRWDLLYKRAHPGGKKCPECQAHAHRMARVREVLLAIEHEDFLERYKATSLSDLQDDLANGLRRAMAGYDDPMGDAP